MKSEEPHKRKLQNLKWKMREREKAGEATKLTLDRTSGSDKEFGGF